MNEQEELAHLTAPSSDPKQRMIDYWGKRCEKAEAEVERLKAALQYARNLIGPDEVIDAILGSPNKQPAGDLYCDHNALEGKP